MRNTGAFLLCWCDAKKDGFRKPWIYFGGKTAFPPAYFIIRVNFCIGWLWSDMTRLPLAGGVGWRNIFHGLHVSQPVWGASFKAENHIVIRVKSRVPLQEIMGESSEVMVFWCSHARVVPAFADKTEYQIKTMREANQSQDTKVFVSRERLDDYGNSPGKVVLLPQGEVKDRALLKKERKKRAFEFVWIGLNCNFSNGNLPNKNSKGKLKAIRRSFRSTQEVQNVKTYLKAGSIWTH